MSDSIKDYLNSIAKYPLLTPQQEIQLGRRVARLKELQQLERPLTKDEQREVRSGERARQRFIHSNLQLVVHIARKYDKRQNKTLEFMDLIQEGNIGLSRAVDLFDPTRGYKFSTYAYWWIRQGITRALITYDAVIRLPIGVHEMLYKVNRTIQDLSHELGQAPSTSQVAEHLDMDPKDLSMLLRQSYRVTSLDQYISDSENNTIADTIADPSYDEEDISKRQDIQEVMEYFVKYLDETTQSVLKARMISQPMTWAELEKMTGINKTRLYSIQQRGIMRLRMLMRNPLADTPLGTDNRKTR
jgi:RNA polymerase sigma factor (sigma-70 family)